jgi:phosphohistidine phosphatase
MKPMRIVLLRHGIAVDRQDWEDQPELARPLTPKGIRRTRQAALGLRAVGVRPELVLTSPATRALQTAKLALHALRVGRDQLHEEDSLLPDAAPEALIAALTALEVVEVLCVGHAPRLDQILAELLALRPGQAPLQLKKAGAAIVQWNREPGGGSLIALLAPIALRNASRHGRH